MYISLKYYSQLNIKCEKHYSPHRTVRAVFPHTAPLSKLTSNGQNKNMYRSCDVSLVEVVDIEENIHSSPPS
jgi:hypothetical protein